MMVLFCFCHFVLKVLELHAQLTFSEVCCVCCLNGLLCRIRVLIGNSGVIYFSAYPNSYNHTHSLNVHEVFWYTFRVMVRVRVSAKIRVM